MKKINKTLVGAVIGASLALGGCSTAPINSKLVVGTATQYSDVAREVLKLHEKPRLKENPFGYTLNDLKRAYTMGDLRLPQPYSDRYLNEDSKLARNESFIRGLNEYVKEGNSKLIDNMMFNYAAHLEEKSYGAWGRRAAVSEPVSAGVWLLALTGALTSHGGGNTVVKVVPKSMGSATHSTGSGF